MLVSEYIIKKLRSGGVKHVFGVTGTAVNMLFVTLGKEEGIDYICPLHEQGAAMGADGYARVSRRLGVAIATSGPGATNMVTGCAGAYTDSIPVLYILGQAAWSKARGGVRAFGFQEVELEKIYGPITKYAKELKSAQAIRYELEKAVYIAENGRKGPVALIIPENILYEHIDETILEGFKPDRQKKRIGKKETAVMSPCLKMIKDSQRPLFLFGAGIHKAGAEEEAVSIARKMGIPVALSYPARDLMDWDDPLNVGSVGVFGEEAGNMALSEADMIIAVGVRFDQQLTGKTEYFSQGAKKIVVDIDKNELEKLNKVGIDADTFEADAKDFLIWLERMYDEAGVADTRQWVEKIRSVKKEHPICKPFYKDEPFLNPYFFMDCLSSCLGEKDIIFSDTGLSTAWIGQGFKFKKGQRWHTQFSYSSMGYALPGALGGSFAKDGRVICICGDGGLQMSLEELGTLSFFRRNIKLFVIVNEGYGMIQKTQDDFNNGHHGTDRKHHVPLPDVLRISRAYGLNTYEIKSNKECHIVIKQILSDDSPAFCAVYIPMEKKIQPRVKAGSPLYEMIS